MAQATAKFVHRHVGWGGGSMPAILMYHSVSPYTSDPYQVTVSPARFRRQMAWMRARGLRGVGVGELLAARARDGAPRLIGVRTHVQSVLTKLGVHSRLEAASFAVRYRLLDERTGRSRI
jgi:hypothetical protein